ncbi:hypothetical protein CAter282_1070 [Collimonas arenae]|uniref:Secreted protein n=1 Tax=Collimonas arenae TaxID=279058 RepID=A0A127QGC9_9BURK|nr:hypothetical protein [Collimonas arenae]AMO98972.1 hypothetical protein CAter10_1158 [Collimonas arenae]AMP08865.1 hypothetical protein CAter282_1070 [Collimonas arenae]
MKKLPRKELLGALALVLATIPFAYAQNEPIQPREPGAALEGHPDARNDRSPASFYDGAHRINTHSVMRCKDGTLQKARADACRGHDEKPK